MTNIIAQISSYLIYWALGLLYSQNLIDPQKVDQLPYGYHRHILFSIRSPPRFRRHRGPVR